MSGYDITSIIFSSIGVLFGSYTTINWLPKKFPNLFSESTKKSNTYIFLFSLAIALIYGFTLTYFRNKELQKIYAETLDFGISETKYKSKIEFPNFIPQEMDTVKIFMPMYFNLSSHKEEIDLYISGNDGLTHLINQQIISADEAQKIKRVEGKGSLLLDEGLKNIYVPIRISDISKDDKVYFKIDFIDLKNRHKIVAFPVSTDSYYHTVQLTKHTLKKHEAVELQIEVFNNGAESEFLLTAECRDLQKNLRNDYIDVKNYSYSSEPSNYYFVKKQFLLSEGSKTNLSFELAFSQNDRYELIIGVKKLIPYLEINLNEAWVDQYLKKSLLVDVQSNPIIDKGDSTVQNKSINTTLLPDNLLGFINERVVKYYKSQSSDSSAGEIDKYTIVRILNVEDLQRIYNTPNRLIPVKLLSRDKTIYIKARHFELFKKEHAYTTANSLRFLKVEEDSLVHKANFLQYTMVNILPSSAEMKMFPILKSFYRVQVLKTGDTGYFSKKYVKVPLISD